MRPPDVFLARNWLLACYDAQQLQAFGLPPDHTQRLHSRNFDGYALRGSWLPSVELRCFSLKDADLSNANLRGAQLCCVDLSGAGLASAHIAGADLQDADLRCVDARRANFRGADLRGAKLVAADLSGADLSEADLAGASLDQAEVAAYQIRRARNWCRARFSASLLCALHLPEDHNATINEAMCVQHHDLRQRACCDRRTVSVGGTCLLH